MRIPQTFPSLLRLFLYVLLFVILVFLLVGIIHLLAGWQTIHQYGNGLVWAGVIGVIVLLITAGWRNGRREDLVALSTLMREDEVFYLLNRDNDARARFMFVGLIALIITFVIGLILLRIP
jgi:hypothetical protein